MEVPAEKGREEELLVFGYACKLFRDDEKALFIDSGKHLIPWMADETLKIDRYDGRGALSDLRPHEPPPGGYDRWQGLTERERKLEEVVDQERYMALYKDEDEERMLEEEEWKRLQSLAGDSGRYNQIGFSYGAAPAAGGAGAAPEAVAAAAAAIPAVDDEPYEPPTSLNVPADMAQPATRRHADIIERTALFVARQGPQMEILIKAKQSENAMFDFLAFDDPLQPFFRHMVVMIKAGRYTIGAPKPNEEEEDEAYLHPALNLSRPDIAPGRADGMYQPSANCAYQRLVKNIRSSRQAADSPTGSGTSSPVPAAAPSASAADSSAGRAGSPAAAAGPREAAGRTAPATAPALPPADVKLIIDKMASYVAKNGRDFEGIVMGRGDERFSFLRDSHAHHAYYRHKLEQYERDLGKSKPAATTAAPAAAKTTEDKGNKPVPVSFSIRAKSEKDSAPLERSALPLEESEDEEGEEGGAQTSPAAAAAGATAEANGGSRPDKAAAAVAVTPAPAPAAAAAAARPEPTKRQSRQVPIVAPAPGVGRDEIQMDRKRRAAQFLAKLRQDVDKIKQPVIGPQLPPGPLPSGSEEDPGGGSEPPAAAEGPPSRAQTEEEEEDSGDEADLDKYKLVDSDSPHSVPELPSGSGASADGDGSDSRLSSPASRRDSSPETGRRTSRDRNVSRRDSRDRSVGKRDSRSRSVSKRDKRDRSASKRESRGSPVPSKRHSRESPVLSKRHSRDSPAPSKRHGRDSPALSRRDSRDSPAHRRRRAESREPTGSRRRADSRERREERRHRRRHKKRSSHRRRRGQGDSGSEQERPASLSPVRSRSPRRHKKHKKRPRSPPASYKRLLSSEITPVEEESRWRRSARREPSRSPARSKRKRSRSSKRHKHKSKKSKRSKRSRSRSAARLDREPSISEVAVSPAPVVAPSGDVIDLTGGDSPERRLSQPREVPIAAGSPPAHPAADPAPGEESAAPAETEPAPAAETAGSTPRVTSPTPVPSAAWSPAGSRSRSRSASGSGSESGSDSGSGSRSGSAASSRSGSPRSVGRAASGSDRDRPPVSGPKERPLSNREEEARRTREAFAQLKRKLDRRRPAGPANGLSAGAARPAAGAGAGGADPASSSLVAQMAEGLKAKVHEMMKGSLLGK
ncbi:splicing factor, suppressor of white-apricot homolog [Amphibalanus amphitrite]|uniref:splicing factor, suppressor of white-apricot homolog n=1 Tax=Amphibalanus amphitrite TaxID=1232801 RepID=UPI001C915EE2|nr:splicing factor, suppressor of white-apricot homolog [Amphibalanus amphitrite]